MKNIGISSFAYRYSIGLPGLIPINPMSALDFLHSAHELGFQGVQLCENLNISDMDDAEWALIKNRADELGLFLEVGMNTVTVDSLTKHIEIADRLSASFLRVVLGGPRCYKAEDAYRARDEFIAIFQQVLPLAKKYHIAMGIENHFDLPTYALREIVDAVDDESLGLIVDTTNGIHFLERPEETLEICRGRIVSIHLKDYLPQKVEAGHFISGTVLGNGDLDVLPFLCACDNIIMEMTTRRPNGYTIGQVIQWEKNTVEASAKALSYYVNQLTAGG